MKMGVGREHHVQCYGIHNGERKVNDNCERWQQNTSHLFKLFTKHRQFAYGTKEKEKDGGSK